MKTIRWVVAFLVCASSALAEPTVYPGNPESYKKLEPSGSYSYSSGDDQWHANSASYPMYCSVTGGSVTATPVARCGATHLQTIRAAPSGANVSLTLTGMCPSGTCYGCTVENIDATNACAVAFSASDASEGRILYSVAHPTLASSFDSWAHETSVTSIRVATSGISDPESRTIGACDLQVTCCGL